MTDERETLEQAVTRIAKQVREELHVKCWCEPAGRCHNCVFLEAWLRHMAARGAEEMREVVRG